MIDERGAVVFNVAAVWRGPALEACLEGMETVVQVELAPGHGGTADLQLHVVVISVPCAALAAVWFEFRCDDANGLARLACHAHRVKGGMAEAPPAAGHAFFVLGGGPDGM